MLVISKKNKKVFFGRAEEKEMQQVIKGGRGVWINAFNMLGQAKVSFWVNY
jgi:hypothetical protein